MLFHYLKFMLFQLIAVLGFVAFLAGGHWISVGLLALILIYVVGDRISGDELTTPTYRHPGLLTFQLWLALPLQSLMAFVVVWSVSPTDVAGVGQWVFELTGYDALAARAATAPVHHLAGVFLAGLMLGLIGTIVGHELIHRTWDPRSMLIGRWLLAFTFDTVFAIEHVYGHHRYVSTKDDPATAPRGRNVYYHILSSTVKGNVSGWRIEQQRLKRKGLPLWSWHNAVLRGYLMSAVLVAAAGAMGGVTAMGYFIACGLAGKAVLEVVNYMEHYGLVRNPATPVQPRHSWNTNSRMSSWTMFNLTRHSHHHAQGEVAFQNLKPFPDAPMMIGGYLTTILVVLIPPLWHALMTPKVLDWDRRYATDEELKLARQANAASGLPAFIRANSSDLYAVAP